MSWCSHHLTSSPLFPQQCRVQSVRVFRRNVIVVCYKYAGSNDAHEMAANARQRSTRLYPPPYFHETYGAPAITRQVPEFHVFHHHRTPLIPYERVDHVVFKDRTVPPPGHIVLEYHGPLEPIDPLEFLGRQELYFS